MTAPLIRIQNASIVYQQRLSFFRHSHYQPLRDVSFDIFEGETLGIIGKNGCGKSTLLKMIAGIFEPDGGVIDRGDVRISLQTLATGFDQNLTGRDNALISSMYVGHTKKQALQNLDEIADFSELGEFFQQPLKTYSSGMRARLGFSVALTVRPDVLLIDEVLSVGDGSFRIKAEKAIIDKISSNQTVVLVTHSAAQISRLCNRVVWLENGVVRNVGSTEDIVPLYEASNAKA